MTTVVMKRKLTCTNYFIILEKKDFQESTPKIQMLMFRLSQTSRFGLWDIIPSEFQLAFHIYYEKYENKLVGTWGGLCFKNIFLCIIQKSGQFGPRIKPYIYENRKSNAKS